MRPLDDNLLERRFREARTEWPSIEVGVDAFRTAVAAALAQGGALEELHTSDLFLALGCLTGHPAAARAFEAHVVGTIRSAVQHAGDRSVDDTVQSTIEKLLFGPPPSAPKLAQYTGRGSLVAWVRVVAVRESLQTRRRVKRAQEITEELADLAIVEQGRSEAASHELCVLRNQHGESFRRAVKEAIARLEPEQRALLRLNVVSGLTIDALAPMLEVHRATVARRIEKARADALAHTQAILRERDGLTASEAESLCVALVSEVDVSIGRALEAEAT